MPATVAGSCGCPDSVRNSDACRAEPEPDRRIPHLGGEGARRSRFAGEFVLPESADDFRGLPEDDERLPVEPDALENKLYALSVRNVLVLDVAAGEYLDLIKILTGL